MIKANSFGGNGKNQKRIIIFLASSGKRHEWNKSLHVQHQVMEYSYNICFTETNVAGALPSERITEYLDEWSDIHKQTLHGFAICFNTDKV